VIGLLACAAAGNSQSDEYLHPLKGDVHLWFPAFVDKCRAKVNSSPEFQPDYAAFFSQDPASY